MLGLCCLRFVLCFWLPCDCQKTVFSRSRVLFHWAHVSRAAVRVPVVIVVWLMCARFYIRYNNGDMLVYGIYPIDMALIFTRAWCAARFFFICTRRLRFDQHPRVLMNLGLFLRLRSPFSRTVLAYGC